MSSFILCCRTQAIQWCKKKHYFFSKSFALSNIKLGCHFHCHVIKSGSELCAIQDVVNLDPLDMNNEEVIAEV